MSPRLHRSLGVGRGGATAAPPALPYGRSSPIVRPRTDPQPCTQPAQTSPLFCTLLHSFRPQTVLKSSNANLFRSKPLPLPYPLLSAPRPEPDAVCCAPSRCPGSSRACRIAAPPERSPLLAPLASTLFHPFTACHCHSAGAPPWCDWALRLMCRYFFLHLVSHTPCHAPRVPRTPAPSLRAAGCKGPSAEGWRQRTVFCCFASSCPTATHPALSLV